MDNAGKNEVYLIYARHYPLARRMGFLSLQWRPVTDYFSYLLENCNFRIIFILVHGLICEFWLVLYNQPNFYQF